MKKNNGAARAARIVVRFFAVLCKTTTLRTVPTILLRIRSAHLEILGSPMGGAYWYTDIYARFKTMRRKQNLATALGIQKENRG